MSIGNAERRLGAGSNCGSGSPLALRSVPLCAVLIVARAVVDRRRKVPARLSHRCRLLNAACCCCCGRGVLPGFWPDAELPAAGKGSWVGREADLGDQPELAGAGGG